MFAVNAAGVLLAVDTVVTMFVACVTADLMAIACVGTTDWLVITVC